MVGVSSHPLHAIQQNFLERLHVRVFAADSDLGAAGAVLGLFALVAEHGSSLFHEDRLGEVQESPTTCMNRPIMNDQLCRASPAASRSRITQHNPASRGAHNPSSDQRRFGEHTVSLSENQEFKNCFSLIQDFGGFLRRILAILGFSRGHAEQPLDRKEGRRTIASTTHGKPFRLC